MTTFKKGYRNDVGVDVCLDDEVRFEPFETKVIDTKVSIKTYPKQAIMMCARTSAAKKGIIVNQCPVDPGYSGNVHVIAHNCSKDVVVFEKGQAFAQMYCFEISEIDVPVKIKKEGLRTDKAFGSSDKE